MFLEAEMMATGTLFEILGSASYRDSGTLRRRNNFGRCSYRKMINNGMV